MVGSVKDIMAIDMHAHYGTAVCDCARKNELKGQFMSASSEVVLSRAQKAKIELTVVSPLSGLMPRFGADPIKGNEETAKLAADQPGFMQWVVVDPLKPQTFEQTAQMLLSPKCVGIKIHPEEHGYPINQHGQSIFEFAAKFKAIIITHSGEQNSLPEDFVKFADAFPEVRLIVAHHGFGWDGDPSHQVRAIQMSRHGNIFTDTSSASNVLPGQIEWAVKEVGADKVLFGTDTPLYFSPMQRARVDNAEISDEEKELILRTNALILLGKNDKV
jgi:predicted TIM-barrel fold metal-dependent hydrolase